MNTLIMYSEQLYNHWRDQVAATRRYKSVTKSSELANAKAEQIFNDLQTLYNVVVETDTEVAAHIFNLVRDRMKMGMMAEVFFTKHLTLHA